MVSLVQNFLAVWVCLILIPRLLLPKLFAHVNNLFIYLHEKLDPLHLSYVILALENFISVILFPRLCYHLGPSEFVSSSFLLTDFDIFVQMNSVGIL